jgi:arylsulfatase A-like enzyme
MDPRTVPGVLLANRRVVAERPGLVDMAPTILEAFGIDAPGVMDGRNVFESPRA